MSVELMALVLIGGLIVLMALGMEIAVAMGIIASLGFILFINHPQSQIAWTAWDTMNSFTLVAMPLFIFMGTMYANTGVVKSLFDAADKWVGVLPGGLVTSVLVANAIFGAISGSSIAAVATFSTISFPEMEKRGYDTKLSLGAIAVGGTLSVLIPPSIILVIYGAWENQSVARLFAAAIVPGIILAILLILTVIVMVTLNPKLTPTPPRVPWKERLVSIRALLPWIAVIVLVLGAIFAGMVTPTEGAALGAFLSILLPLGYKKLTYKAVKASFLSTVKVTAMIAFVMVAARLLAFVFQSSGLTKQFGTFMMTLPLGKYGILALITLMYLVLGMFFDATAMLLLTIPFVMPVMVGLGFNPIWFGVFYVVLVEIGLVTPPFALNLFTMHGVLPQYSITTIAASTLPFLIPMLLLIALLVAFPQLALWLPGILY